MRPADSYNLKTKPKNLTLYFQYFFLPLGVYLLLQSNYIEARAAKPYTYRKWEPIDVRKFSYDVSVRPNSRPRVFSQAFDTYAVSYQNITTQRFLLEKQAYWLICQGQKKKSKIVGKACSRFYARISSLLTKPELHNKIGSYRRALKLFS